MWAWTVCAVWESPHRKQCTTIPEAILDSQQHSKTKYWQWELHTLQDKLLLTSRQAPDATTSGGVGQLWLKHERVDNICQASDQLSASKQRVQCESPLLIKHCTFICMNESQIWTVSSHPVVVNPEAVNGSMDGDNLPEKQVKSWLVEDLWVSARWHHT